MLRLIRNRLLLSVPLLLVVSALTFVLQSLVPGDAARAMLGVDATPAAVEAMRVKLGLNRPWYEQYGSWLDGLLHGRLGQSLLTGQSVTGALSARLGVTLSLMVGVGLVCLLAGTALGVLSAVRTGWLGRVIDALSVLGLALPSFWVAMVLVAVFAVSLGWLPASGYTSPTVSPGAWVLGLILPVAALALGGITLLAKQARDSMLDALSRDYIRSLRASGLSQRSIVLKHALKNAATPLVTVLGTVMIGALTGSVFIESIFVMPGLGSAAQAAAGQHDLPIIEGVALYFTLITIAVNLLVDVLYGWINPKVRAA